MHIPFYNSTGEKTDQYMGASEMLMATSVTGILFSLLSGQPLLITGFTGPNMVFEEGIYKVGNGWIFHMVEYSTIYKVVQLYQTP